LPAVNPTGWCVEGAKILELCEKGDKLLDDEIAKVYKGKKVTKGPSNIFAAPALFSSEIFYSNGHARTRS
jgi:hypothetical protein